MRAVLFLRSFFNQALINYRGMTHLGILWALLPVLRRQETRRRERMVRAFGFFNSHPYLAGYIIGASARMEEDDQGELLERLKKAAVGPWAPWATACSGSISSHCPGCWPAWA